MKAILLSSLICLRLLHSACGIDAAPSLIEQAAHVVIGPEFGQPFDPANKAFTRISDKATIRQLLGSVVGKQPEEVGHRLLLPHLQIAVLNVKGDIIAAYAFDRCPSKNSKGVRAVLRIAKVVWQDGKAVIEYKSSGKGYPCNALQAYLTSSIEDNGEQSGAD